MANNNGHWTMKKKLQTTKSNNSKILSFDFFPNPNPMINRYYYYLAF